VAYKSDWNPYLVYARSRSRDSPSNWEEIEGGDTQTLCVCVLRVRSGLATGLSPVQGVLPTVYRIRKLKERPRPNKRAVGPNEEEEEAHK
jgi:hypothetical protein